MCMYTSPRAVVSWCPVQACNLVGKPVLITRVVDTMVNTPRPTRAEATDVANAVLDGVDGILLGAETLRGKYPLDAVRTVASICRAAESVFDHGSHYEYLMEAAFEAMNRLKTKPSNPDLTQEDEEDIAAQMVSVVGDSRIICVCTSIWMRPCNLTRPLAIWISEYTR